MCKKSFLQVLAVAAMVLASCNPTFAIVWEGRVASSIDDDEQYITGAMVGYLSTDLEMPYESRGRGDPQTVGIRFRDVKVPKGAEIAAAYVEFVCDETKDGSLPVSLVIDGQLDPDSPSFSSDIIGRRRTTVKAVWEPENWTSVGQVSQTSDISAIITEIINQDGWASGNALVLIISNNPDNPSEGIRCAESYDGAGPAPLLHIEFSTKYASNPAPPDGSVYGDTWASLSWRAGDLAVSHDIYFGDNFDDVNNGVADTFQGNQADTFFVVGLPGFPYPDGLVPGTTYYWRIDEINDTEPDSPWVGEVWSFMVPPKTAYNPGPPDGAMYVDPDVQLSWAAGLGAKIHTVYFGDNFDDVNNASDGVPQKATTYTPGPLEIDKTYYWRVDEFAAIATTHKGIVWSFNTVPIMEIVDPNLIGWWKFDQVFGSRAIDFSGYGNHGEFGGNPQWVEGIIDGALELDGDDYVTIDSVVDEITSTNITLSIWVKSTGLGQGDLFAANDSDSGHPLEFYVSGGYPGRYDGGDTNYPSAPPVADGEWHMMTYVREGDTCYIYVDGVQAATDSASFDLSTVTRWSIGQEWDWVWSSDFYFGLVDDARFYNASLSAEQVAALSQ